MSVIEAHPAADLFPMFGEEEFQSLVNDIKENGLLDPLVIFDGKILDGRNRQKACAVAGVEPKTVAWVDPGCGPTSWVLSKNLHRRQLTKSQAAAVAVEAEALFAIEAKERQIESGKIHGIGQEVPQRIAEPIEGPTESRERAGALLGVNRQYVSDAKKLRETAPETYEKVKAGSLSLSEAKREQKLIERRNELAISFAEKASPAPIVVDEAVSEAMKLAVIRAAADSMLKDLELCLDATHRVLPDPETFSTCDEGQVTRLHSIASEFEQIARDLRAYQGVNQ